MVTASGLVGSGLFSPPNLSERLSMWGGATNHGKRVCDYGSITPIWTEAELDQFLNLSGGVIKSDVKVQRDKFTQEIQGRTGKSPRELSVVITPFLTWKTGMLGLHCGAGHIEIAEKWRSASHSYDTEESIEIGLIERVGQPVYQETDLDRDELVESILLIVRSSAVSQLRPEFWADDDRAREYIQEVLQDHADIIDWASF